MKIQQDDILPGAISFTRSSNFAITSTGAYVQDSLVKSAYAIGVSGEMLVSDPLSIKDIGNSSVTTWADEQDWTGYNKAFTTSIPVIHVSSGTSTYTLSTNANISVGDLVGIYGAGSWFLANNLNAVRFYAAGIGMANSALVAGGLSAANLSSSEIFNGTSWLNGSNLSISKFGMASIGSVVAGMVAGGTGAGDITSTDFFNGTIWTSGANLPVAKSGIGAGSQNAGLVAAGGFSSTDLFNGATWSSAGLISANKFSSGGTGSQSAALIAGGTTLSAVLNQVELFNGSSWSVGGNINTARRDFNCGGSQNGALLSGGLVASNLSSTEIFNGSAWLFSSNLSQAKRVNSTIGSPGGAISAGGSATSPVATTELHNQTLYRKIVNSYDLRSASGVGIAFDVTSTTLSVKYNGFVSGVNVTSSNVAVTNVTTQWPGKFVTFPRFSPNASTTNNPGSVVIKNSVSSEDFLLGYTLSRTQMEVFIGNMFAKDKIGGW